MSALTVAADRYADLRRGDRVLATAMGEVPGGAVVAEVTPGRVAVRRPAGLPSATLYADQHGTLTVARRDPRPTRRTYGGLTLVRHGSEWLTLDGRHRVSWATPGWYVCDAPHPVREARGRGYYCWGGVEHAYAEQWCPYSDDSSVDSAVHGWEGTLREAATHLADVLARMGLLDEANTPRPA